MASDKIPQHVLIKPGRTCVHVRFSPTSLPSVEATHFDIWSQQSAVMGSSGLIWRRDGIGSARSPPVMALWRCATVHQCAGERSASLWARAEAPPLCSTCCSLEVQHYESASAPPNAQSPLWTPIQLDCFFVCLFHFGHTLPSQELICGLLQVTVWRWQTCPASLPLTLPPAHLRTPWSCGSRYPRCPSSHWRMDAINLTF